MMDTAPKHNSIPIQRCDRQRGWTWQNGKKVRTPDAPMLFTAVKPPININGENNVR